MTQHPLIESSLPLPLVRKGKVREVYAVDEHALLLVTSDRISAFDVVLAEPIPLKGAVLTQLSAHWFRALADITPNHYLTASVDEIVEAVPVLAPHRATLAGRTMLAHHTSPVPFECVVRGYLSGSAWKEYRAAGTLAGEPLPDGLVESAPLTPPIFSPATKADEGHDENVTFGAMREALGAALAEELKRASLELYRVAAARALERGIIIADTKFEFGHAADGTLMLIDEALTPDSSRFWPADRYVAGTGQPSFDKQPLRDHLDALRRSGSWNGDPPPPALPPDVVSATSERYRDAYLRITGTELPVDP